MESVGINSSQDYLDQVESQMDSNAVYYFELKLGIRLSSQTRIYLISQSNFYDVLTRPYKYLSNTISTLYTRTTCTQDNIHVSFTRL